MNTRILPLPAIVLTMASVAQFCRAQTQRPVEVAATIGANRRYVDIPAAVAYGGSVSIPVAGRFTIRPEILADTGEDYQATLALVNVMRDFTDPHRKAAGYWVASFGGVRTYEAWVREGTWQWAALGGIGMRFDMGERWTARAEFRMGSPAFPVITFGVGLKLGTRR